MKSIRSKIMLSMLAIMLVSSAIIVTVFMIYVKMSGRTAVESFVPAVAFDVSRSVDKTIEGYGTAVAKVAAKLGDNTTPMIVKPMFDNELYRSVAVYTSGGVARDGSEELALAVIDDKEYSLIKACSVFERDNLGMISALSYLKMIFRDALLFENGANMLSNQKETARKLASSLTKSKLLKLCEVCDKISALAAGNGNNALLITKLCYELRRAQGR